MPDNTRGIEITVISGDLDTPGSIIEIPWSVGVLGSGPIKEVDPKTRKAVDRLQRFEITSILPDGTRDLKPIRRTPGDLVVDALNEVLGPS